MISDTINWVRVSPWLCFLVSIFLKIILLGVCSWLSYHFFTWLTWAPQSWCMFPCSVFPAWLSLSRLFSLAFLPTNGELQMKLGSQQTADLFRGDLVTLS